MSTQASYPSPHPFLRWVFLCAIIRKTDGELQRGNSWSLGIPVRMRGWHTGSFFVMRLGQALRSIHGVVTPDKDAI